MIKLQKLLNLWQLLAVMLLTWSAPVAFGQDEEPVKKTYTVYCYDTTMDQRPVKVHVWDATQPIAEEQPYLAWDYNEAATFTGQLVEIDGYDLPVYSYTFEWDKTPTGIIFRKDQAIVDGQTYVKFQTADLGFVDGALYCCAGGSNAPGQTELPEFKIAQPNHKVYFVDTKNWGVAGTKVHVWNDWGGLNVWADNEPMTGDTGKYVKVGNDYFPMYYYEFYMMSEPKNIIFHNASSQTGDNIYVEGGVYYAGENKVVTEPIENPDIVDEEHLPMTVVYFADTGGWGAERTLVHIWGDNGDYTPFDENPSMTSTGKFVRVNDVWAPVYKFEYRYSGKVTGVLFHESGVESHCTCDLKEINGAVYYYTGSKKPVKPISNPVLEDEIPSTAIPGKLVVNLGANQIMQNLWWEPCAHVFKRSGETDYESLLPEYGGEQYKKEIMTKVRDGLYEIDIDDIHDCNDVIFYYAAVGSDGKPTYRNLAFPASRSTHNDPTTWATFIYDIGLDCVHQSYMTPEEYTVGWANTPTFIYMTGNKLVTGSDSDDPINQKMIRSTDDVYIYKFAISAGDIATFKLSRFSATSYATKHGFSVPTSTTDKDYTYDSQRGWATFNLGIIGCQPETGDDWYTKYIYQEGHGTNRQIRLWINNTMGINNYNQYPWRIGDGEGGVTGGNYWLVVDLHEDDNSLSLLTFDPNPKVASVTANDVVQVPLTYAQAQQFHSGDELEGTAANGKVWFDKVNVLSGTGQFTVVDPTILDATKYTVVYTIYCQDIPVATFTDNADNVTIPYLMAGTSIPIKVKGHYTDLETGLSFCSAINSKSCSLGAKMYSPWGYVNKQNSYKYYKNADDKADGVVTVGGAIGLEYGFAYDNPYACFADYKVRLVNVDGVEIETDDMLVHSEHFLAKNTFKQYLGMKSDVPWRQYADEEEEYAAHHNWSNYIRQEKNLPIFLTDLKKCQPNQIVPMDAEAYFYTYAVYPFLIRDISQMPMLTAEAETGTTDSGITLPDDLAGLRLITSTARMDNHATFNQAAISGIEEIQAEGVADGLIPGDDNAEYFTLGGVRLQGKPTLPGIYLMRSGNAVSKIAVH